MRLLGWRASIGGGSDVGTADYLSTILKDYKFNVMMIEKYGLDTRIDGDDKNYVFALGFRGFFDLFNSKKMILLKIMKLFYLKQQKNLKKHSFFSSDKKVVS